MESTPTQAAARQPWTSPRVLDLPPLKNLTLQTTFPPVDTDPGSFSY